MKRSFTILLMLTACISKAQNVGIGTNTPLTKLHVRSANYGIIHSDLSDIIQVGTFVGNDAGWFGTKSNHPLYFFTNGGNAQLAITTNGFVGIGTASPDAKLEVNGQIKITGGNPGAGKVLTTDVYGLATWAAIPVEMPAGNANHTIRHNGTAWVNAFNLSNDGTNVGVGTLTPSYLLDINGRARLRHNGVTPGIWFNKSNNTEGAFIGMVNDTTTGFWGNGTSGNWRVTVDVKNSRLGIGVSDPSAPLAFANNTGNKINLWGDGDANHYGLGIQGSLMQLYSESAATDIAFGYGSSSNFTERMRIKGNGNVGIGTNAPAYAMTLVANNAGFVHKNGAAEIGTYNSGSAAYIQTFTNHHLNFATNNAVSQMTLSTAGNLGIGTFPSYRLDVSGVARVSSNVLINGNALIDGSVKIGGGAPAANKVLTATDNAGNAVWRSSSYNSAFEARLPANVPCPNGTATKLGFVTSVSTGYDDGGNFNNSNSRFIVPENGVYHFDVSVLFCCTTSANNGGTAVTLSVNGIGYQSGNVSVMSGQDIYHTNSIGTTIKLNAGDYVEFFVGQNTFVTITASTISRVTGYRVY